MPRSGAKASAAAKERLSVSKPEIRTRFDSKDEACVMHLVPPSSADRSPLMDYHTLLESEYEHTDGEHGALSRQDSGSHRRKARTINYLTLGFIAYFAVAAGRSVWRTRCAPPDRIPCYWQSCFCRSHGVSRKRSMTAELSTMIDENGGYILWVRRGLGEFAGWMNAFNSIASNVCDLPTYPVLFCSYVEAFLASGFWGTALLIVFTANAVGMRAVALASVAMSLFVLAPFVLEPLSVEAFNVATWGQVAPEDRLRARSRTVDARIRSRSSSRWCLITINYAFPVAAGIMVEPDFAIWKEGMLETVAMRVGHWLGVWVGAAAVIATLGEFNVVMACSSRALWATADYRMMPRVLATEWDRYGTPIAAVIFQTCTTAVLMSFSFEFLVVLDTFFNNTSLLLEFFAFLRLKYIEKDTERPFEVPFGNTGAWAITLPKILVLSGVLLAQSANVWLFCGSFNVIVALLYLVWKRYQQSPTARNGATATTSYGTSKLA
ncbi:hypothetical protein PINS_up012386 [Pythium insidiosum]|nr:hypothetical protein PINS_up012386 [Pythium insidiosum]